MADAHFEIYDAQGRLVVDLATALLKSFGTISTGTSNGSHSFDVPAGRHQLCATVSAPDGGDNKKFPVLTQSGNTVSWSFPAGAGVPQPLQVGMVAF